MKSTLPFILIAVVIGAIAFFFISMNRGSTDSSAESSSNQPSDEQAEIQKAMMISGNLDTATFGAGCFWCVEAVFQDFKGVVSVVSGYSNGHVKNPTYKQVCNGNTGHAEVAQIVYDPAVISFEELLEIFWNSHDPTTLNRQGADVGTQYRSGVYYHNEAQRVSAEKVKAEIEASKVWDKPIVTEIVTIDNYSPAEDYHQNYYNLHGSQPYCQAVIAPKISKIRKKYADKLKPATE